MFERSDLRASGLLEVGGGHSVYWAVHLHGGPGAGLSKGGYRKWLDPGRFRIIGPDQRGCGRSTPHVTAPGYDLQENTTAQLIGDLERLRQHLGVRRWLLNGVSCGSTLDTAVQACWKRYATRTLPSGADREPTAPVVQPGLRGLLDTATHGVRSRQQRVDAPCPCSSSASTRFWWRSMGVVGEAGAVRARTPSRISVRDPGLRVGEMMRW